MINFLTQENSKFNNQFCKTYYEQRWSVKLMMSKNIELRKIYNLQCGMGTRSSNFATKTRYITFYYLKKLKCFIMQLLEVEQERTA